MAIRDTSNDNLNFGSSSRARVYKYIIAFAAVIFIGRLGQLQIIQGSSYKSESETQAIKQLVVEPFRGNIFDRNGKLIVHNEASFSVVMTPNDFNLDALPLLLSLLPLDTNEIIKAYSVVASEEEFKKKFLPKISTLLRLDPKKINIKGADRQKFSRFTPVKIYKDANFSEISMVQEYNEYLPGIDILIESKRLYEFEGNMAHLLGYTREISDQELKKYQYYRQGDNIGKKGLEKSYENLLRGQPGIQFVAVNSRGEKISSFDRGQSDIRSTNGFDLTLGIDKDLQELAERKLTENNSRGSVVAIDPSNGEIMVLAAKPDFDPRQFTGKITSDFYKSIMNDPDKPMYNRAIQSVYSPGSTWKMLVAIAGLQEGFITENTTLNCSGGFTYGGRVFKCHGAHGAVNVKRAIQASCNVFFYQLGLKIGMENFEKYGKMFGFGDLTYIDIPDENKGILPTMSWLQARKMPFTKGKLLNYGIGQGEISVSPLQMAIYCATLANKGTLYQPHVVRYVHNNITGQVESIAFQQKKLPIDKRVFDIVQQGMFDVVNLPGGTANNAKIPGISVCGKTGTAQNPHGRDHAWFICYAPMENPKIAICVMVENSGFGAVAAAPIARDILYKFFYPDSPLTQDKIVMEKSAADSLEPGMTFGDQ